MSTLSHMRSRIGARLTLLVVMALIVAACGGGQPQATVVPAGDAAATTATTGEDTAASETQSSEATAAPSEEQAAAGGDAAAATPYPTVPAPAEVSEGAASAKTPAERADMYTAAPEMTIDPAKFYYATLSTAKGDIKVQLFADRAPETVNNFVFLAREGYYNDTVFHRVIEGFMAQAGDPTGTGMGGPGYQFADEIWPGGTFDRPGLLAMANAGPGTNGSQFFLTFGPTEWLDGMHTIFGEVVEGLDVLDKITRVEPGAAPGDTLYTVTIEESDTSALPTPTALPPTPTPFAPSGDLGTDRPLAALPVEERVGYFNTAPEMTIDTAKSYTATITTSQGDLVVSLLDDVAPAAVNNFVMLADLGFYDGTPINDVSPGELVVLGSPTGDPSADVGYTFKPELSLPITPTVGSVAYRALGQDPTDGSVFASGSQLYLAVMAPPPDVNTSYSFFGQIVEGLEILPSLTVSDTIEAVTVVVE